MSKGFLKNYVRALQSYWPTARVLSRGYLHAVGLFFLMLSIPVRKRLFGRTLKRLPIVVAGKHLTFYVRDGSDISVLREMFTDKEYAFPEAASYNPKHIADFGAHIGAAALFLHARYPHAKITAYEADPENFAVLQKNIASLPNISAVHAAVAATRGGVTLYAHAGGSTRGTLSRDPDTTGELQVPSVTFEDVVATGVDCVKFDVEGAEYNLLAAASLEAREKVELYFGEFHESLTKKSPAEFTALFPRFTATWHGVALVVLTRNF